MQIGHDDGLAIVKVKSAPVAMVRIHMEDIDTMYRTTCLMLKSGFCCLSLPCNSHAFISELFLHQVTAIAQTNCLHNPTNHLLAVIARTCNSHEHEC